ncbi:putative UbiA prenyltransferase [Colletotrichum sublineola]|uniref:Putative UbiA prenyltransferase n=1 Tax=Colletotrichum sublineola TaxID=1173701 RepID=A0A066X557_COLSU|nr:putative UbiA prenyltransferase [Colletotrichum sublineola]
MLYKSITHAIALYRLEQSAKQCKEIYSGKPTPEKVTLFWHLVTLSRFNKYNPLFTTFAGVWSVLLAGASELVDPNTTIQPAFIFRQAALCFLAAYLFCGAGMVWNDWVDRDIDAKVTRTKDRPLASGTVTTADAILWMALQLLMSLAVVHNMLDGKDVYVADSPPLPNIFPIKVTVTDRQGQVPAHVAGHRRIHPLSIRQAAYGTEASDLPPVHSRLHHRVARGSWTIGDPRTVRLIVALVQLDGGVDSIFCCATGTL